MRQLKLAALALVVSALSTATLAAEPAAPAASGSVSAPASAEQITGVHKAKVSSRLAAVDTAAHQITLDFPKGQQTVIDVGDHVKNLAKMKVGNLILVRYTDTLALTPQGDSASASAYTVVIKNPLDHIAVLHGPDGAMRVHVADDASFKSLSVGQKLEVTSTKRVATELSTISRARHRAPAASAAQ